MKPVVVDLNRLLNYFNNLSECMDKIYSEELTWENIHRYNFKLDYKHPDWVKAYFPLVLIYHKDKAGKLRKARKESTMFQNNFNVLTQTIWTADDFGIHHRKNAHKGWKNIVAGVKASEKDFVGKWRDRQPPQRFKNFEELLRMTDPSDIRLKALCSVLSEHYKCDSIGQLRLL